MITPGRAAVDAQRAPGADVLVDDEGHVVVRVLAGLVGADGLGDRRHRDHVDALPRADVDAALAEDALGLVDVQELLRLDRLGQEGRVDLLELVVDREVGHGRVRVGARHRLRTLRRGAGRRGRRGVRRSGRPKRDRRSGSVLAARLRASTSRRFCHITNSLRFRPRTTT